MTKATSVLSLQTQKELLISRAMLERIELQLTITDCKTVCQQKWQQTTNPKYWLGALLRWGWSKVTLVEREGAQVGLKTGLMMALRYWRLTKKYPIIMSSLTWVGGALLRKTVGAHSIMQLGKLGAIAGLIWWWRKR
jgi:hypothetical protein